MKIKYFVVISLLFYFSCHSLDRRSKSDINGFWITENQVNLLYIHDDILANNNSGLNCIYRIHWESGSYFWIDSCINKPSYNTSFKYLVEPENDQLFIYFDENNMPWKYSSIDFEKCSNNLELVYVSFRDNVLGQQIVVELYINENILYVNGVNVPINRSLDWIKSYCFDNIELSRTDIDYPIPPTGKYSINLTVHHVNGIIDDFKFNSLLEAPLDVQALLIFIASISYNPS